MAALIRLKIHFTSVFRYDILIFLDPPLSQQFVHVLPPFSLKPPTQLSITPTNSQLQFPNIPTVNQSDASIVKSRDVTSQSAEFFAGNTSASAVPPLPKKTVAPYQEYKFGFEEPMPELKIPATGRIN